MADKTMTEEEVVGRLRSGMTIAIGGWGSRRKPMSLVRAIVRSDRAANESITSMAVTSTTMPWARNRLTRSMRSSRNRSVSESVNAA